MCCVLQYSVESGGYPCEQPVTIGSCTDSIERWYWDPITVSCERFQYSGCGGSDNNFKTFQQCSSICGQLEYYDEDEDDDNGDDSRRPPGDVEGN